MILAAVFEARSAGARLSRYAEVVAIDARTLQRWACHPTNEEARRGPRSKPHNSLTATEKREVLGVLTSAEYRDLSPNQVVPKLADSGRYMASESTMYRLLRQAKLNAHRIREPASRAKVGRRIRRLVQRGAPAQRHRICPSQSETRGS